jgi:hypothetical protein
VRRTVVIALVIAAPGGCSIGLRPLKPNEMVAKKGGRHVEFKGHIVSATFCPTCGRDAPVTLTYGDGSAAPRFVVNIPNCYAHGAEKIGDKDHFTADDLLAHEAAGSGELDITDCLTTHVTAKVKASFPSGIRIESPIDTDLVAPGSDASNATGSAVGSAAP